MKCKGMDYNTCKRCGHPDCFRPDNEYYGYLVNYNKIDRIFEAVNNIGESLSNAVLNILLDDVRDQVVEKKCNIENRS